MSGQTHHRCESKEPDVVAVKGASNSRITAARDGPVQHENGGDTGEDRLQQKTGSVKYRVSSPARTTLLPNCSSRMACRPPAKLWRTAEERIGRTVIQYRTIPRVISGLTVLRRFVFCLFPVLPLKALQSLRECLWGTGGRQVEVRHRTVASVFVFRGSCRGCRGSS
jgi:hypothetical protein